MEYVFFWIVLAIIVGVAANTRGRNGFGWFLLAVVISPLFAGLLLLALPRWTAEPARPPQNRVPEYRPAEPSMSTIPNRAPAPSSPTAFEPDGVYAGIPYKVTAQARLTRW
jgi:hypothetical protein